MTYSLFQIEFRYGPSVQIVAASIGTAMAEAVEYVNSEVDPDDPPPVSLIWHIADIVSVVEMVRGVVLAKEVMVGGSDDNVRGEADRLVSQAQESETG